MDERVLVGYLVAGDPHITATVPAMHALADNGVDVIEVGMPFSDPEAEGPDIQAGHERALAAGVKLSRRTERTPAAGRLRITAAGACLYRRGSRRAPTAAGTNGGTGGGLIA